jgi:hypothetical protein
MYAAAFFEKDPRKIVEIGRACLPAQSPYARLVADLLDWHKQYPKDWQKAWQMTEEKWNRRDPCPEGALKPFNIDAKLNGAYIALGLLWGEGDFTRTMEVSTRAGQDSDCNPASAIGVLGVMYGYDRIPEVWKGGIPAIAGKKFSYTDFTFEEIVESTYNRAIALVKKNGGRVQGDNLVVRLQKPKAAKLEVWDDYGSPVERIPASDGRWKFSGSWKPQDATRVASEKPAEAEVEFEGSGVILVGPYFPDGGLADVYLDGKLDRTVDVYPDEPNGKGGESVWHAFGLKPGKHSVRLVVRGERYKESNGSRVGITDVVVFR